MTKEFISRKTAGNFQKTTSQFAPRPFATPQQKSAKTENSTPQDIQCSPESSNRLSQIAITQPETFTPQLTVQRAEQAQGANDNPGEEAEKIQRSSTGNNRLAKISIQPPEPPSTPRFPIQAKLTVGAAGDRYEQEADRVAQQVVNRIHAPQVNLNSSESNPVQRKISIQAFGGEGGDVSSEWESQLNQARGGGQPLSPSLREPMEREFGADFSGVRVHTGAQADGLAKSIQAKAFTTGQDVFFRQGAYEPGSRGGQELIAHELTHVVQQKVSAKKEQKAGRVVALATEKKINRMMGNQQRNFLTNPRTRTQSRTTGTILNQHPIINSGINTANIINTPRTRLPTRSFGSPAALVQFTFMGQTVWGLNPGTDAYAEVRINYSGSRNTDYTRSTAQLTTRYNMTTCVWHHYHDYNPINNQGTMYLMNRTVHANNPHYGGVWMWQQANGVAYNP